jgi:hypothetical protein
MGRVGCGNVVFVDVKMGRVWKKVFFGVVHL